MNCDNYVVRSTPDFRSKQFNFDNYSYLRLFFLYVALAYEHTEHFLQVARCWRAFWY
jgi:hypothetical protein